MNSTLEEDYQTALRTGESIERHTYEKETDAGMIVATCIIASIGLIALALILFAASPAQAQLAPAYSDEQIVNAIYRAEGGNRATYLYGIRSVNYDSAKEAREICLRTVRNNRRRYRDHGRDQFDTYLQYLASRYAPVGVSNDTQGLNKNWLGNVIWFLEHPKT